LIPLPDKSMDIIKLADWMEICALITPDGDFSRDDLDATLRAAAIFPPLSEDSEIADLTLGVFRELESRRSAALNAYPFEVSLPYIKLKSDWKKTPAYAFCLCLSYFGDRDNPKRKTFPRRCFEHLARDAVQNYIGGEAIRFASPRNPVEMPRNFGEAIERVCASRLMEGGGFKKGGGLPDQKDCNVDIIGWKHFPDKAVGKIVLFGNCATGKEWYGTKLTELMPKPFCAEWMVESIVSPIVRSFFMPHRCESQAFMSYSRRAGIIFDRCRIAYWCYSSHRKTDGGRKALHTDLAGIRDWTAKCLKSIRS